MPDEEILKWFSKQLDEGFTKAEIIDMLKDLDYSDDEIKEIIAIIPEKKPHVIGELPKPDKKKKPRVFVPDQRSSSFERKPLSELMKQESGGLWKILLFGVVLALIVIGLVLLVVYSVNSGGPLFSFTHNPIDSIPPRVSITASQDWFSAGSLEMECFDSGIDFSSGCDNSTLAFLSSKSESCPRDYSLYSPKLPDMAESGFLCASMKDNEGNIGFSNPVYVKFDLMLPATNMSKMDTWFSDDFSIELADQDKGSGLANCSYRLVSLSQVVLDWKQRTCNSSLTIPIGVGGCKSEGNGSCVVEAYAVDAAGNKGNVARASYNIDLTKPVASIGSVNPSRLEGGVVTVEGKVNVTGTAIDPNFKEYTLEWKREGATGMITKSKTPTYNQTVGSLDTSSLSNRVYTLVIYASDLAGKTSFYELQIKVSNTGASCTSGSSATCSSLKGVCSSSIRVCGSDGSWSECGIQNVTGYQAVESNCTDGLDNDCNGLVDCVSGSEDPSCECTASLSHYNCSGNRLVGDVSGNGQLDFQDVGIISLIVQGNAVLDGNDCCADVNDDGLIDLTDSTMLWDFITGARTCFPQGYSCSTKENCTDGIDNDCDSLADGTDPDCGGSCTPVESSCPGCSCGLPCCGAGCDPDGQHCFDCLNGIDSVDSLCEADGTCGAADECDEKAPGSVSTNSDQCCITGCSTDNTMGSCTCTGGNCNNGYCLTGTTCYYGVSCQTSGWSGSICYTNDSCSDNTLTVGKSCTGSGCGSGTSYTCNATAHTNCQQVSCGGTNYNCTFDGSVWKWRTSPPTEAGHCSDGVDNDCNDLTDNADPACGGCIPDGGTCAQDDNCCSQRCDKSISKCFSCVSCSGVQRCSSLSPTVCEQNCQAQGQCDNIAVDSSWIQDSYSCRSCADCNYLEDHQIEGSYGNCDCHNGCNDAYCHEQTRCYYGVSCTISGWTYTGYCWTDQCSPSVTITTSKSCGSGGCSGGTVHECNSTNECQNGENDVDCGGQHYNCHYMPGAGYVWYAGGIHYGTEADCSDGHDNDCDDKTDCDDPDCDGTPTCP